VNERSQQGALAADENYDLLPCPFCGTNAELNTASNNPDWMIISCPSLTCAVLPQLAGEYAELEETIAAWNKRAPSQKAKR
jgi:hypothetical protein